MTTISTEQGFTATLVWEQKRPDLISAYEIESIEVDAANFQFVKRINSGFITSTSIEATSVPMGFRLRSLNTDGYSSYSNVEYVGDDGGFGLISFGHGGWGVDLNSKVVVPSGLFGRGNFAFGPFGGGKSLASALPTDDGGYGAGAFDSGIFGGAFM